MQYNQISMMMGERFTKCQVQKKNVDAITLK